MNIKLLNSKQVEDLATQQLFSLENGLARGDYGLSEIGNLIPGAVMVHDIEGANPQQITYMNDWGCETLGHSMDELNAMGDDYYREFFIPEESKEFTAGMVLYYNRQDHCDQYNFFHRVKTGPKGEFNWYYAMCKFLRSPGDRSKPTRIILLASPITGICSTINKVNKILDQNIFVANNYKKFISLTKREREIITLLTEGKSSVEISDQLFISKHTVSKHRRNIVHKLEIGSFAELLKFAMAFELIR